MFFNVRLEVKKTYNRTFKITAPNKLDAFAWGEKQAEELGIKASVEVFKYVEE